MDWIKDLEKINEITKDLQYPLPLQTKISIIKSIGCKDVSTLR